MTFRWRIFLMAFLKTLDEIFAAIIKVVIVM